MNVSRLARPSAALLLGLSVLCVPAARAQNYQVTLDTSGLSPGDSYAVDLQLNQGDNETPASTVEATNFTFGPGGGAGPESSIGESGTASGDLSTGVTLAADPTSAFSDFYQNFTNGGTLTFLVNATGLSAQVGTTPTGFIFDLFDNTTSAQVPTTGPSGLELFTLTRDTTGAFQPTAYSYTGGASGTQAYTTQFSPVSGAPEPSSVAAFVLGGLGAAGLIFKARRRSGAAGA